MKVHVQRLFASCRSMDFRSLGVMLFCVGLCAAFPAHAQIQQVSDLMESVLTALTAVSITAVTIAVILTGYKMAYQGASLGDCAPVIIGGIVIGAARPIAELLV